MDINKHRYYLTKVLLDIFQNSELSNLLAFKGGTSLMLFYNLPRFSTDIDLNILDETKAEFVYKRLLDICREHGNIADCALKFYGPIIVIQYEKGGRLLKIEASTRQYDNHYETKNLFGTEFRVMTTPDMFAHKLCALTERITPRDVFDVWFFLKNAYSINSNIIRIRTGQTVSELSKACAKKVRDMSSASLMQGLGDVMQDKSTRSFVKNKLINECATNLDLFSEYPQIADQPLTRRMQLIDSHPEIIAKCKADSIDLSTLSEQMLESLLIKHQTIQVNNKFGNIIELH